MAMLMPTIMAKLVSLSINFAWNFALSRFWLFNRQPTSARSVVKIDRTAVIDDHRNGIAFVRERRLQHPSTETGMRDRREGVPEEIGDGVGNIMIEGKWPHGRRPALWDGRAAKRAVDSLERVCRT
jgi:hypothetical protein